MIEASASLTWLFATLSLLVAAAFPLGAYWAERRLGRRPGEARRTAALAAIGAVVWIAGSGAAAAAGWLTFDAVPPTMGLAVGFMWVVAVWIGVSRFGERLALGIPLATLVGVQGFRLPLELLMHQAYVEGLMPVQMSYSGWNLDILTGITAIIVALLLLAGHIPLWGVRLWNWMGIALLVNIVVIANLSAPTPLRVFMNEPANVWITYVPFVWLPMVMVMTALVGHVLLIRRLRWEALREDARYGAAARTDPGPTPATRV